MAGWSTRMDRPATTEELDPRLHYANERTFLAWIRTSLALVTAGLVVTQLLPAFRITGGRRHRRSAADRARHLPGHRLVPAVGPQRDRHASPDGRCPARTCRWSWPVGVALVAVVAVLVGAFASVGR